MSLTSSEHTWLEAFSKEQQKTKQNKNNNRRNHFKSSAPTNQLPLSTTRGSSVGLASQMGDHWFNYLINILRPRGPQSLTRWLIKGYERGSSLRWPLSLCVTPARLGMAVLDMISRRRRVRLRRVTTRWIDEDKWIRVDFSIHRLNSVTGGSWLIIASNWRHGRSSPGRETVYSLWCAPGSEECFYSPLIFPLDRAVLWSLLKKLQTESASWLTVLSPKLASPHPPSRRRRGLGGISCYWCWRRWQQRAIGEWRRWGTNRGRGEREVEYKWLLIKF